MPTKSQVPPAPATRAPPAAVVAKPPLPRPEAPAPAPATTPADGAAAPASGIVAPAPQAVPQPTTAFRSRRAVDTAVASALLALGVLVIREALRMGIGWGSDGPQGGFVPFWLAVVLVLCTASIVIRVNRRPSREKFATRQQLACVLQVMVPAVAMIVLIPYLGLYVAGATYTALYMRWGGRHSWAFSLVLPVVVLTLLFLVFEKWFLVPLPKGPIEAWLGY